MGYSCCRNPGLALPLIALQYHEVRICLEFRNKNEMFVSTSGAGVDNGLDACNSPCAVCVPSLEFATLFVDYIYLDTDERRRFAQVSHEYLIEQLQFTGDESVNNTNVKIKLNFNHPVKELIWVIQRDDVIECGINQWNNYTDDFDNDSGLPVEPNSLGALNTNIEAGWSASAFPYVQIDGNCATSAEVSTLLGNGVNFTDDFGPGQEAICDAPVNFSSITDGGNGADHAGLAPRNAGRNPTIRAKLQLNGHDRFQERLGSYFNLVQPYQHHTNIPATGINVYSFALKPEEHQPSGTCNFSRIDNATLQLQLTPKSVGFGNSSAKIRVYATNYNVLRIMSGIKSWLKNYTANCGTFFTIINLFLTVSCQMSFVLTHLDKQCKVQSGKPEYNWLVQC